MTIASAPSQSTSAQPHMTAAIMVEIGLDEEVLRDLVHWFYGKVRRGPVFAGRIADRAPNLERIVASWSRSP